MTTPTLARPRNIPRRSTLPVASTTPASGAIDATPVTLHRAAGSAPTGDPQAGLTRAQRQALKHRRRAGSRQAPAARTTRPSIHPAPTSVPRVEPVRIPAARVVPATAAPASAAVAPSAPVAAPATAPTTARRVRRLLGDVLFFALLAAVLWFTWPASLGGRASFVVVHGHSMDGTYRSGDIVLVRERSSYHVGDIAAYHVPEGQPGAGSGVIHRVKRIEGDRYVFQGDNRTTEDQWRPRASDVIGRALLRIPMAGETFWALLPWLWCAAVGITVTWMLWPTREPRRPRRRRVART